jgi:hypothetical protein
VTGSQRLYTIAQKKTLPVLEIWFPDKDSHLPAEVTEQLTVGMCAVSILLPPATTLPPQTLCRLAWTAGALGTLGNLPVAVIAHGQPFPGPFAVFEKYWRDGQQRLAALSTNSVLPVAQEANHMIQNDDPKAVVGAIRRVVTAVRTGEPLAAAT